MKFTTSKVVYGESKWDHPMMSREEAMEEEKKKKKEL